MTTPNSFSPRFDPQSISPYDQIANNSSNPFGPEPFAPTPFTNPGTPLHSHTRDESPTEEGEDVGSRVDRGHGSPMGMTRNPPQERSRFVFAQERIERTANASTSQIPAAHAHQSSASQSRTPAPIKATPTTVSQVLGPRPFRSQSASHARREPTLAALRTIHPLPTRLTDFEDYEEGLDSDRVEYSPLSMTPLLGFSNSDYTDTGIEVGDRYPEADEHFDNGDEDYDPFEFDVNSDFGSDYVPFGSGPFAPYVVGAFDWPTPYQGQIPDGEGCPHASGATLWLPPQGSPSFPLSGPHAPPFDQLDLWTTQLPATIPWSAFTDPFTGAPITVPPLQSSATLVPPYHVVDDDLNESGVDWLLDSRPASELTFDSSEGGAEGWYDQFHLTGYAFPVPPQQPESSGGYWV